MNEQERRHDQDDDDDDDDDGEHTRCTPEQGQLPREQENLFFSFCCPQFVDIIVVGPDSQTRVISQRVT